MLSSSTDTTVPHPDLTVQLREDPAGSADFNMAADEEMFLRLEPGCPTLAVRFYYWDRPSISIGRFQDPGKVLDAAKIRSDRIGFVRRMTGGRSVFHPEGPEGLTCSFALSSSAITPFGKRSAFLFLHGLFIETLAGFGIASRITEHGVRRGPAGLRADCFDSASEFELVSDSEPAVKLMGSAQFADQKGILQQTSIPLGPGLDRLSAYELRPHAGPHPASPLYGLDPARLTAEFFAVVRRILGPERIRPSDPDAALIRRLCLTRYGLPDWNEHRNETQGAFPQ